LIQKTREEFSKNINPTDEEINTYMALYSIPADKKEEAINLYKSEKGAEAFREALLKARKEMQIKDLAPEYENLLEKTAYEEEGFTITNLDLARSVANVMLGQKISREDAEKQAKEMITRQIKMAKIAKEKGVKVNENLDSISQFQDYYVGLAEKVRDEVKPTDDELLKFFNANKAKYSVPATADAKLIFISVKSAKEDDDLAKEKAEKLLSELTPENFTEKGKSLGNNQDIIYQDLGTFGTKAMVKEFEEALKEAKKQGKPLFVDFYATWCGPCKKMEKTIFTQPQVGKLFNEKFVSLQMDAEKPENVETAKKYKVDAFPTLGFIDTEGKAIAINVGFMNADELIDMARPPLGGRFY